MRAGPANDYTLACMGDSITAECGGGASTNQTFCYLLSKVRNCGNFKKCRISGNTTTQMLARYSPDTLAFRPGIVGIMDGVNDMTSNISGTPPSEVWSPGQPGAISVATSKANLKSMVQQAQAARAGVALMTSVPVTRSRTVPN